MAKCKDCGKSVGFIFAVEGRCLECHDKFRTAEIEALKRADAPIAAEPPPPVDVSHIILSTESAPDLRIAERLDIVTAEFAVGMGLLTDVFSAWRDVFGGRAKAYQNTLKDARKTVLQELRREAHDIGADAVLGVSLDYSEISGGGKSMLFLVASGTAVRLAKTH